MSNEHEVRAAAMAVFELPGKELREMVLAKADSIEECLVKIRAALAALPPEGDDVPEELRRSAVFKAAIMELGRNEEEARYLADHIREDRGFQLSATQILAFKRTWSPMVVNVDKLAWAPVAAPRGSEHAERMQAELITQTPRIAIPSAALVRDMGL